MTDVMDKKMESQSSSEENTTCSTSDSSECVQVKDTKKVVFERLIVKLKTLPYDKLVAIDTLLTKNDYSEPIKQNVYRKRKAAEQELAQLVVRNKELKSEVAKKESQIEIVKKALIAKGVDLSKYKFNPQGDEDKKC